MLPAHLRKEIGGRTGALGSYIIMPPADALYGFLEILTFPFEIRSQSFIECDGRILAMSLSVFLQLGLAFWLERYRIHQPSVRGKKARVKRG
jgi:hypothetical protein